MRIGGVSDLQRAGSGVSTMRGGGGGGTKGREVRFGVIDPADVDLRGATSGVSVAVDGLPLQGAPLEI